MNAPALLILVACLFLGIALFLLGMRGKKINDHPQCRQCGFDLVGVYPQGVTCPECGAGLKREKFVRLGVRRKMPLVMVAGLLLALLPLAPIGLVLYATITGTNINKHLPLGVLLWQSDFAGPAASAATADELLQRMLTKSLDKDQTDKVIKKALAHQADANYPWNETWGDIIERADLDGNLSPADRQMYLDHATRPILVTRENIEQGTPLPFTIANTAARVGSTTSVSTTYVPTKITIDGKEVPLSNAPERNRSYDAMRYYTNLDSGSATLTATGTKAATGSMLFFGTADSVRSWLAKSLDLTPGTHRVEVEFDAVTQDMGKGMSSMISVVTVNGRTKRTVSGGTGGAPRKVTLAGEFAVVPTGESPVTLVTPTPAMDETLSKKLAPQATLDDGIGMPSIFSGGMESVMPSRTPTASLTFDTADLPVDIAYDVILRIDDRDIKMGTLTTSRAGEGDNSASGRGLIFARMAARERTGSRTLSANLPKSIATKDLKGDVILKPNPTAAGRTIDLKKIYHGTLTFKNVPINRSSFGGTSFTIRNGTITTDPHAQDEDQPAEK